MKSWLLFAAIGVSASCCFATTVSYSVKLIDTGNNDFTTITSISQQGVISGYAYRSNSPIQLSFTYEDGKYKTISAAKGANYFRSMAMNDNGVAVGYNDESGRAEEWNGKTFTSLAKPQGALKDSFFPTAINNAGDVVGLSTSWTWFDQDLPEQLTTPILWHNGVPQILPPLASQERNRALAINNEGVIAGISANNRGVETAVIWEDGKVKSLGQKDGRASEALGINDHEDVIGTGKLPNDSSEHGFEWAGGRRIYLGAADTPAAINNAGQIVGNLGGSPTAGGGNAGLWENGHWVNLNTLLQGASGWQLADATGIDDQGDIVGEGVYQNREHAFLLTPIAPAHLQTPSVNAVPLPNALIAGAFTMPLAIAAMRRSSRRPKAA